jgi:hypothetical protein
MSRHRHRRTSSAHGLDPEMRVQLVLCTGLLGFVVLGLAYVVAIGLLQR